MVTVATCAIGSTGRTLGNVKVRGWRGMVPDAIGAVRDGSYRDRERMQGASQQTSGAVAPVELTGFVGAVNRQERW